MLCLVRNVQIAILQQYIESAIKMHESIWNIFCYMKLLICNYYWETLY